MNNVSLIGRLGADPELRYTQGGTAVAQVRIAVSNRVKQGEEWVDKPMWIAIKAFEKQAENLCQHIAKGDEVGVSGRLELEEWEDRNGGGKRSAHVVVAARIDFLRKRGEGAGAANGGGARGAAGPARNGGQGAAGAADGASRARAPGLSATPGAESGGADAGFVDDDLPF